MKSVQFKVIMNDLRGIKFINKFKNSEVKSINAKVVDDNGIQVEFLVTAKGYKRKAGILKDLHRFLEKNALYEYGYGGIVTMQENNVELEMEIAIAEIVGIREQHISFIKNKPVRMLELDFLINKEDVITQVIPILNGEDELSCQLEKVGTIKRNNGTNIVIRKLFVVYIVEVESGTIKKRIITRAESTPEDLII